MVPEQVFRTRERSTFIASAASNIPRSLIKVLAVVREDVLSLRIVRESQRMYPGRYRYHEERAKWAIFLTI